MLDCVRQVLRGIQGFCTITDYRHYAEIENQILAYKLPTETLRESSTLIRKRRTPSAADGFLGRTGLKLRSRIPGFCHRLAARYVQDMCSGLLVLMQEKPKGSSNVM